MKLMNLAGAASALAFAATTSHAAVLFMAEASPGGVAVNIDNHKNLPGTMGTVLSPSDVTIAVIGNADFASGNATIKPIKDGAKLTDLIFTPTDPTAFDSFSFRGMDLLANQTIVVTVTDQNGGVSDPVDFLEPTKNADFARIGVIAALAGETIKSVEIYNSGGFKESKQFAFDVAAPAGVPEPATWGLMLVGFAALGSALRAARRTATVA
jgi:hypothetical protein